MLTTNQRGAISEAAVTLAAVRAGIGVLRPLNDGLRYDLAFDVAGRLLRVQCKTAIRKDDVLVVPFYSARRSASGFVKRRYVPDEVDGIAAYCPDLDRIFYLPLDRFPEHTHVQLRIAPTRNNQQAGVNWAADFAFESLDWTSLGP